MMTIEKFLDWRQIYTLNRTIFIYGNLDGGPWTMTDFSFPSTSFITLTVVSLPPLSGPTH